MALETAPTAAEQVSAAGLWTEPPARCLWARSTQKVLGNAGNPVVTSACLQNTLTKSQGRRRAHVLIIEGRDSARGCADQRLARAMTRFHPQQPAGVVSLSLRRRSRLSHGARMGLPTCPDFGDIGCFTASLRGPQETDQWKRPQISSRPAQCAPWSSPAGLCPDVNMHPDDQVLTSKH